MYHPDQLDRLYSVFLDAVPRQSFGAPPPFPPLVTAHGLTASLERIGHVSMELHQNVCVYVSGVAG